LFKDRDLLRLEKIQEGISKKWYILPQSTSVKVLEGILELETIKVPDPIDFVKSQIDKNVLWLDKERLEYPLTLRSWTAGDRLNPFGMMGSQLVSDILTNRKLSKTEKEQVLVLFSAEKLLWVLGERSSRHYAVTSETQQILKIKHIL
jgi:tRNA(Ile)-lysidine synthase